MAGPGPGVRQCWWGEGLHIHSPPILGEDWVVWCEKFSCPDCLGFFFFFPDKLAAFFIIIIKGYKACQLLNASEDDTLKQGDDFILGEFFLLFSFFP